MNLFGVLEVAGSALGAERLRAELVASNMANIETTRTAEGGPYRRRLAVFRAENLPGAPLQLASLGAGLGATAGRAVRIDRVVTDTAPPFRRYQPGHPDADAKGYVAYLFGGTADKAAPFVVDPTAPSGVRYAGNNGTNSLPVGEGLSVPINVPGSQLFSTPGADVFQTLHDLATAVQTNVGVGTTVLAVRHAFDSITSQRVFFGNSLAQLGSQQTYLNGVKLQLATQENAVGGADPAAAATAAVTAATARTAALQAANSLLTTSLFNFLK